MHQYSQPCRSRLRNTRLNSGQRPQRKRSRPDAFVIQDSMSKTAKFSCFLAAPMRWLATSITISIALCAPLAWAQGAEHAEVNRLMRAGQMNEALAKADQYLASKPRDAQMRFLKGVLQSEVGKPNEAIATFTKLTADYPELPEPYNNLAVLYAAQSQFDKARAALEMAIRTNPSYATAHENLGDVYAKLASQAYSKALQLDASNTDVEPKLSLILNLFAVDAKGVRPTATATNTPAAATTSPPAATTTVATKAAPVPAPAAASAQQPPATKANRSQDDVEAAVQSWAKAWSKKNMQGYLGAYAQGFVPPGGQSRKEWEADRKARILPRNHIEVKVSDLKVSVNGDRATAKFHQAYNSDNLNTTSRKTLELVKSGGRWLILRESTGG
jgi:tetratricopeptide (TPR) repeat protein